MSERSRLKWVAGKDTPRKTYITRVFNFGTYKEWKSMKRRYPKRDIMGALRNPLKGQWTIRAKRFAEVVYGVRMPKSVLVSYDV